MLIFHHITLWKICPSNLIRCGFQRNPISYQVWSSRTEWISRYIHIFSSPYYFCKNSPSNLNRCGFQRNRNNVASNEIVTNMELTHWHQFISQWDLRPIHVVIITTLTAVVNYILWTSARFDINMRVLFFTSFWLLKRWYILVLIITISGSRLIEFWCQLM